MKYLWVGLALLTVLVLGCGQGEVIPLTAPGPGSEWPVDPGWRSVGGLFAGYDILDGVVDSTTGTVVLVGNRGAVFECRSGQWTKLANEVQTTLRSVISLGADEYLAVGDVGGISHRTGGRWLREESGTQAGLELVIAGSTGIWALGHQGTVLHREETGWRQLPAPTTQNLGNAAVVHDSLFVVSEGEQSRIMVWADDRWATLDTGPWGSHRVAGVATLTGADLYAAADSFYVRDATGWRTITGNVFETESRHNRLLSKVVGPTLWYSYDTSWYSIDPAVAPWQPSLRWSSSGHAFVPLSADEFLTVTSSNRIYWFSPGERRQDLAAVPSIWESYRLAGGGLLLETNLGLMAHDGASLQMILPDAELAEVVPGWIRAACGRDQSDFFLVTGQALYHYQDGQMAVLGSWGEYRNINSLALAGDGRVHMADDRNLWLWSGTDWTVERPLPAEAESRFMIWADGAGGLLARDSESYYFRLQGDQWLPLGRLGGSAHFLAAADGSLIALRSDGSSIGFPGGNTLRVYDEQAGTFRNLWARGMGSLRTMDLQGALSFNGELLVWTMAPGMVFRLNGDPRQTDWEVVAGPLAQGIRDLTVLPDGSLLVLDSPEQDFYLYQR